MCKINLISIDSFLELAILNQLIMFLIVVGIIVLVITAVLLKSNTTLAKFKPLGRIIGLIFISLGIVTSCVKQINAGEVGVKILFGSIQSDVLGSGLHFINPLLDVKRIDVKTQNYTMSGVNDEGNKLGDDAIRVLTSDGLEVTIDLTVLYRVVGSDAPKLLRETGDDYRDKIVRPITRTKIRDNAVYYQAVDLFGNKRDEFQQRIYRSIEETFKSRGLMLEQFFDPPRERGAAVGLAQGIADYQRIINTGLTDQQLQYEQIKAMKELALSQNAKVIVMGKGNTPLIIDGKQ